jgi:hypothetical protein
MAASLSAVEILDREFLAIRSRLIDLAAMLDRIDRAGDSAQHDPRRAQVHGSLEVLTRNATDRAEQIQKLFSLPYREGWRQDFSLDG